MFRSLAAIFALSASISPLSIVVMCGSLRESKMSCTSSNVKRIRLLDRLLSSSFDACLSRLFLQGFSSESSLATSCPGSFLQVFSFDSSLATSCPGSFLQVFSFDSSLATIYPGSGHSRSCSRAPAEEDMARASTGAQRRRVIKKRR